MSVASADVRLVVTTWNLQGSKGVDVETVAAQVRVQGSDVLLLQEVQRRQARRLAQVLEARSLSWAFKHWPVKIPAEGMAVVGLSHSVRAHAVATTRRFGWWSWRRRIVQVARLPLDGASNTEAPLTLVNVHLSPHDDAATRAREIVGIVGPIADTAAIVGGDLNDDPNSAVAAQLADRGLSDAWSVAHPRKAGTDLGATNWCGVSRHKPANRRIDYLWVSAGVTVGAAHVPTPSGKYWKEFGQLSDHLPLTATLEIAPVRRK